MKTAILLAAGLSKRMGRDKLLLPYKGITMLDQAIELLDALPCQEKIIVTTTERLAAITLPKNILPVINPSQQAGQSESLRLGIMAAGSGYAGVKPEGKPEDRIPGYYIFLNADQPRLTLAGILDMIKLSEENPDKIIYPEVNGKPTTPVLFPARYRSKLLTQKGDTGGRKIRETNPTLAFVPENPENFMDVDCLADYELICGDLNR